MYRLAYNVFSVVSILPLLILLATRVPATILWRVRRPFSYAFVLVQLGGLAGLALSLLQTDVWRFAGVRQALRYLQGAPEPDPPGAFVQSGTYGLVRHPLYLFSMLLIWFTPLMTLNTLLFNILATLYFLLGAIHEERRLLLEFGEAYRRYREEVPAFLPWPRGS
jgi:protein-S-isoprenylcysteine O-methyltransferase Ste14